MESELELAVVVAERVRHRNICQSELSKTMYGNQGTDGDMESATLCQHKSAGVRSTPVSDSFSEHTTQT